MKSNVKLYVDAGAMIRGSSKNADYTSAPAPPGGRPLRAFFVFDNVENAGLMGRGTIDMEGYPWLWHDFQPDNADGNARDADGKVLDPHGSGIRGYVVNNCRNISFQDLLLLRSAYWTVYVIGTDHFSTRNLKIVNRKQQYHDDDYDFSASSHILIEDGFAMSMDDTWAFYRGTDPKTGEARGIEDFVVKGFVNYTYTAGLAIGYGAAPPVKHLRFEDVNFIANHNKFAIWIQLTPAYFTGRGYSSGAKFSRKAALDDFRFVNCSFENDGGHVYIDGGEMPLTNFVFENCVFYQTTKPSLMMGTNVAPVLFKNVKVNGAKIRDAEQLERAGFDLSVPVSSSGEAGKSIQRFTHSFETSDQRIAALSYITRSALPPVSAGRQFHRVSVNVQRDPILVQIVKLHATDTGGGLHVDGIPKKKRISLRSGIDDHHRFGAVAGDAFDGKVTGIRRRWFRRNLGCWVGGCSGRRMGGHNSRRRVGFGQPFQVPF